MKYQKYFSIRVNHTFLGTTPEDSFRLVPDVKTSQLIQGHKLRLVHKPMEFTLYQPLMADETTPLIPIETGTVFGFDLQFMDPDYAIITDWPSATINQMMQGYAITLFSNESLLAAQTQLPGNSYEPLHSDVFRVNQPGASETFFLKNNPRPGLTNLDFSIRDLGGVSTPSTYVEHERKLTVNTSFSAAGDIFEVEYAVLKKYPQLTSKVEIVQNASLANGPTYEINLDTTSVLWRCYVILKSGETQVTLTDDDSGRAGGSLTFSATTLLSSGNAKPEDDTLVASQPNKSIVLLTANRALPYRRAPYRQFRLAYLQTGETTPIEIAHIPNPGIQHNGRVIIYLS
jgi:hypothetical protein